MVYTFKVKEEFLSEVKSPLYKADASLEGDEAVENIKEKMKDNGDLDHFDKYEQIENPIGTKDQEEKKDREIKHPSPNPEPTPKPASANKAAAKKGPAGDNTEKDQLPVKAAANAEATEAEKQLLQNVADTVDKVVAAGIDPLPGSVENIAGTSNAGKLIELFGTLSMKNQYQHIATMNMRNLVNTSMQFGQSADFTAGRKTRRLVFDTAFTVPLNLDWRFQFFVPLIPTLNIVVTTVMPANTVIRSQAVGAAVMFEAAYSMIGGTSTKSVDTQYPFIRNIDPFVADVLYGLPDATITNVPAEDAISALSQHIPNSVTGNKIKMKLAGRIAEQCLQWINTIMNECVTLNGAHPYAPVNVQRSPFDVDEATDPIYLNRSLLIFTSGLRFNWETGSRNDWQFGFNMEYFTEYLAMASQTLGTWLMSMKANLDRDILIPIAAHPYVLNRDGSITAHRMGDELEVEGLQSGFANYRALPLATDFDHEFWKYKRAQNQLMTLMSHIDVLIDSFFGNPITYRNSDAMTERFVSELWLTEKYIRSMIGKDHAKKFREMLDEALSIIPKVFGQRSNDHNISNLIGHPDIRVVAYGIVKLMMNIWCLSMHTMFLRLANKNDYPQRVEHVWETRGVHPAWDVEKELHTIHCGYRKDEDVVTSDFDKNTFYFPFIPPTSHVVGFELSILGQGVSRFENSMDTHSEVARAKTEDLIGQRRPDFKIERNEIEGLLDLSWKFHKDDKNLVDAPEIKGFTRIVHDQLGQPKVDQLNSMVFRGVKSKQLKAISDRWIQFPPEFARILAADAMYYGHCSYNESFAEAATSFSVTTPPNYFLLGLPTPPIPIDVMQSFTGAENSSHIDLDNLAFSPTDPERRRYIVDTFTDNLAELMQFYFPRSFWTDRPKVVL